MPAPKAGKIEARTRVAVFEIEGDDWEIEYKPFSPRLIKQATGGDEEEQLDSLVSLIERVMVRWNLLDDEGNPKPFDGDWLRGVGADYSRMILEGLMEDMQGKKPTPISSSVRSLPAATA